MVVGEIVGTELVDGAAAFHDGQARVGLDAEWSGAVFSEEPDVRRHFDWAGGAVHSDGDDAGKAFKEIESRADFGAESMVPVCSIVTWTMMGRRVSVSAMARSAPTWRP